jgi:hypothetical protein
MLEVVKAAGVDVDGWTRKAATTNYQASPRSNHRGDRRRTAQRNGSPHGPARTRPGSGVADFAAQDGQSAERLDLQTVRMVAATIRTVFAQSDAKPVHSPLPLDIIAGMLGRRFPRGNMLRDAGHDLLASRAFPLSH